MKPTSKTACKRLAGLLLAALMAFSLMAATFSPEEATTSLPEELNSLPEQSASEVTQESVPDSAIESSAMGHASSTSASESVSATESQVELESEPDAEAERPLPAGAPIQPFALNGLTAEDEDELRLAIAAISADGSKEGSITLTDDITLTSDLTIPDITLYIDGGNHTIDTTASGIWMIRVGDTSLAATVTMENLTIDAKGIAGGIYVSGISHLIMEGSTIKNGVSNAGGGGLYGYQGANITLVDSVVEGCFTNTSGTTGAIYLSTGTLTLSGSTEIRGNSGGRGRGIMLISSGTLLMQDDATVTGNSDSVFLYDGAQMTLRNRASVSGNSAAGIELYYMGSSAASTVSLYDTSHVSHNADTLSGALGAGIRAPGGGNIYLYDNSHISNNTVSSGSGGGVYINKGTLSLNGNSRIRDNTARFMGGGVFMQDSRLQMRNSSQISYNTATTRHGGGVYAANDGNSPFNGSTTIEMWGTASFIGNTAGQHGGAMSLYGTMSYGLPNTWLTAYEGYHYFTDNTAGQNGGAIHLWESITVPEQAVHFGNAVLFRGNRAGNGAYLATNYASLPQYTTDHAFATVRGISLPTNITTHAFNNYDIYHSLGTPLANTYEVNFYINRVHYARENVAYDTPIDEPTVSLQPGQTLVGWYTDIDQVGTPLYAWNFGHDVTAPLNLYAELEESHTVTVNYYTQEQWYTGQNNEDKTTTASETLYIPDGGALATHLATLDQSPTPWQDIHLPPGYSDTLVIPDIASLPSIVDSDLTIYVVYRRLYTVQVEFYRDAETTAFDSVSVQVPYNETPQAALEAAYGAAWYNEKRPAGYFDGVYEPNPLQPITGAGAIVKVRYTRPLAVNAVTYYQNHSLADNTPFHTEPAVTEGDLVPLPAGTPTAPEAGYIFSHWAEGRGASSPRWNFTTGVMPATPLNLYAQYTEDTFHVTFDFTQLFPGVYDYQPVKYKATVAAPTGSTTVQGYNFLGWWYAAENRYWSLGSDAMPAGDITLVARWSQDSSTPEVSSTPSEVSSTPPSSETPPAPSSDGGGGTPTPTPSSSSAPVVIVRSSSAAPSSSALPSSAPPSAPASSAAPSSSAAPAPVSSAPELPDEPETNELRTFLGIPLGDFGSNEGWSLLNLILTLLLAASAVLRIVWTLRPRQQSRGKLLPILAAATGALPLPLFFVLENLRGPMAILSRFTPVFLVLAILHAGISLATALATKRRAENQGES